MKTPPALTPEAFAALPMILTLADIAGIYRKSPSTIRRDLQRGTFRPAVWDRYPYRWLKSDVETDLKRRRDDQTMRKHGFAARPRLRTAKADTRPRTGTR